MSRCVAENGGRSRVLVAPRSGPVLKALTKEAEAETREAPRGPRQVTIDPEKVERGLARLVLGVVELLRKLLERQAVRRVEGGALTEDEIERLGLTLIRLEERMAELKETFGLEDGDLDFLLGQLGALVEEDAD